MNFNLGAAARECGLVRNSAERMGTDGFLNELEIELNGSQTGKRDDLLMGPDDRRTTDPRYMGAFRCGRLMSAHATFLIARRWLE
ncbi:uncharacterized protein ARMOST_17278 [Armillaria ostoyae]|uniref:Uncharacterized protein n=1 Tax=Armillaria ostoyae TaxID=47428 RepID=A0A284RYN9_ARMOS|nr:uncharacterized protein ARMOST_17278 [Armillaria ostoyae]